MLSQASVDDSLVPLSEDDYLGFSTRDHDPFDLPVLPMREIIMPFRIKVRLTNVCRECGTGYTAGAVMRTVLEAYLA